MGAALGPIPKTLQDLVAHWIKQGNPHTLPPTIDDAADGLYICGGLGYLCSLHTDGTIRDWDSDDDLGEVVPDGPLKVSIVVIGARRLPELAEWLPSRPTAARTCEVCVGTGRYLPPMPPMVCPECSGLGWLPPESSGDADAANLARKAKPVNQRT
jgi:hypothetical protein